jgi:hypothetical protein
MILLWIVGLENGEVTSKVEIEKISGFRWPISDSETGCRELVSGKYITEKCLA